MFKLNPINFALLICASTFSISSFAGSDLQKMSDQELSDTTGQALMSLSYIAPSDTANLEARRSGGNTNIGFYKLGLEAEVAIKENIKKLQLGCGGINGANGCDIDIDNLSLSGMADTREGRVASDAVLTNPFLEFAIKNPTKASTREVVGLRVSAEKVLGLLTVGNNNDVPNGINSLSGYMVVNGYGNAVTKAGTFGLNPGETVYTTANINIPFCFSGCGNDVPLLAGYGQGSSGSNTGIKIPSMVAPFVVSNSVVSGTRLTTANVSARAQIPDIPISTNSGQLGASLQQPACIALVICLQDTFFKMNTTISNLSANISFSEGLGYIHNLPINSPFYLGLQQQALQWPGAVETANKGWWLSMQDPINLGDISPTNQVDISSVYPQFAQILGQKLQQPEYKISVNLWDGLKALIGSGITKDITPINLSDSSVNINLNNLKLATQNIVPNCYGGLKFC